MQAKGVFNMPKEWMKVKTEVGHQGWSKVKWSCWQIKLSKERPNGQVGQWLQLTDSNHTLEKTTQQFLRMPQLHLLQQLVLNKGKKCIRVCKCQTPRLQLNPQSRSQKPPKSRKPVIHQTALKHPNLGIRASHQWNVDMHKTLEVTFTKWLTKDATMTNAEWTRLWMSNSKHW